MSKIDAKLLNAACVAYNDNSCGEESADDTGMWAAIEAYEAAKTDIGKVIPDTEANYWKTRYLLLEAKTKPGMNELDKIYDLEQKYGTAVGGKPSRKEAYEDAKAAEQPVGISVDGLSFSQDDVDNLVRIYNCIGMRDDLLESLFRAIKVCKERLRAPEREIEQPDDLRGMAIAIATAGLQKKEDIDRMTKEAKSGEWDEEARGALDYWATKRESPQPDEWPKNADGHDLTFGECMSKFGTIPRLPEGEVDQPDDCREAFMEWWPTLNFTTPVGSCYDAWQAAWHHKREFVDLHDTQLEDIGAVIIRATSEFNSDATIPHYARHLGLRAVEAILRHVDLIRRRG